MTASSRAWGLLSAAVLSAATLSVVTGSPAGAAPTQTTFTQSQSVHLGDSDGRADSEESEVTVEDGQQADSYPLTANLGVDAVITDLSVAVTALVTDHPDDLDILLVGPHGQQVTLMSDAGGENAIDGGIVFVDDSSYDPVPDDAQVGGYWRPADYEPGDTYPAPAPSASGNTDLSVFVGTPAAGAWRLYVVDDTANGSTASFDGFSLLVETATSPYPSQVQVSGIGTVTDVDVSFDGFTSGFPQDADFLLEGPQHQLVTLMSDVGGENTVFDADLRFDDEAPGPVPLQSLITGSYRPTDAEAATESDGDVYPAAPAPDGNTSLSVFDGTNPNGTWNLYAVDDTGWDYTRIDGWALHLEWDDPAAPSGAVTIADGAVAARSHNVELAVSATDPDPGSGVTRMRLSNDGTSWSPYRPYARSTSWHLGGGDGAKTVFAQFADAAGNVSDVAQDTILLDTVRPRATSVVPANDAHDVSPQRMIKITVSEPLDAETVSGRAVKLTRNGMPVAVDLRYDAARHQIKVEPQAPLKAGRYQLKVRTRVRDLAGNRWDAADRGGLQPTRSRFRV